MRKFLKTFSSVLFLLLSSLSSPWVFILLALSLMTAHTSESASPTVIKEWTMLVYLNGNNNLDPFGKLNINQMEEVGSTPDINVVVQWASLENRKTQRLYIVKDQNTKEVTSPVVQDIGNADMGDWKSIVDFVKWGAVNYPAKHYFLDLWDHGSGWHGTHTMGSQLRLPYNPLDISWDDNSGHHITTLQLGDALAESAKIIGHKIDLYANDACLMAMAEIADQVANSVEIFAGSEEIEPGAGWPYNTLMKRWAAHPQSSAIEVSQILTEEYIKSYDTNGINGNANATFSSFDLSKISLLNASISRLAQSILRLDPASKAKILNVVNATQSFTFSDYKDLSDFLTGIDTSGLNGMEKNVTNDVRQSINEFVLSHGATIGNEKAMGLAIWLPGSSWAFNSHANAYQTLLFQSHTKWGDALRFLLQ